MSDSQNANAPGNDVQVEQGQENRSEDTPFLGVRPSWALGAAVVLASAVLFGLF